MRKKLKYLHGCNGVMQRSYYKGVISYCFDTGDGRCFYAATRLGVLKKVVASRKGKISNHEKLINKKRS